MPRQREGRHKCGPSCPLRWPGPSAVLELGSRSLVLDHECPTCHGPIHVTKRGRFGVHGDAENDYHCPRSGEPVEA